MSRRAVPPPLAVLKGRRPLFCFEMQFSCVVIAPLVGVGVAALQELGPLVPVRPDYAVPAGMVVALALTWGLHTWAHSRSGWAELFADRIVLQGLDRLHVVFVKDVVELDDGSADFVRLAERRPGRKLRALYVPTTDDAQRTLLLDVLTRAGVPRGGARATPATPPTPLYEARWPWKGHGPVTFFDDRIALAFPGIALGWDDVVAWRESRQDELRLVLRSGALRRAIGFDPRVPAPPETRPALLALLAARGIPRA